ncbi:MAG: NUDIX domain-containing protein [Blastomonas sp.]
MKPIHLLYRIAQNLRMLWWRIARPTVHGVKIIALRNRREVLLVRHSYQSPDTFMLPGGGIAKGEDGAIAAARELIEETGCRIDDLALHGQFLDTSKGAQSHIAVYIGATRDEPRCDGREIIDARFFPLDALPEKVSAPSARRIAEIGTGSGFGPDW